MDGPCSEAVTETLRKPNIYLANKTNPQTVMLENLHKNSQKLNSHPKSSTSICHNHMCHFAYTVKCFLDCVRANHASRQVVTAFLTGLEEETMHKAVL